MTHTSSFGSNLEACWVGSSSFEAT